MVVDKNQCIMDGRTYRMIGFPGTQACLVTETGLTFVPVTRLDMYIDNKGVLQGNRQGGIK